MAAGTSKLPTQGNANNSANVKVVVRIRPSNPAELNEGYETVTEAISDCMLVFDPKVRQMEGFLKTHHPRRRITGRRFKDLKYAFDYVLKGSAENRDVFEKTTQSIVKTVLSGYNCSVFAYGATGSGKTHTMLGNENEPGVIYHTMLDLYKQIDALKDEKIFTVAVSYLEVYNETVRDLLNPRKNLPIREDKIAGVMIAGLSLHKPDNAQELLRMLHYGNKNRSQHPTDANAESSRSHAVFQVFVKQRPRSSSANSQVHLAKMCLVDLAGSERAIHNRNEGTRFREGANINRSLLALGNVINALAAKTKGHVPYRDSKLTRLLKDSLGGNCQTVMIATVSPSSRSYEDTYNTLRYADRAKHIKAELTKTVVTVDQHIVNYKRYVADLEKENQDLREKARLLEMSQKAKDLAPAASLVPSPTVKLFQEGLHDLFKSRKELMRSQIMSQVVKRELQWKMSRKDRAIKRVERLAGITDAMSKHQLVVERMKSRFLKEEMSLQRTTLKLREHDRSIYGLNSKLANLPPADSHYKELLAMSMRFYVTESYLHDVDMHLCFVKKMARAQERQSVVNERLIMSLLQLVRKQHDKLKSHDVCSPDLEQEYKECRFLVEEKGVAWAQSSKARQDGELEKNPSLPTGEDEKEDLSISDIIDMQLPRLDLNVLKLGNLISSPGKNPQTASAPKLEDSADVNSGAVVSQHCAPQRMAESSQLASSSDNKLHTQPVRIPIAHTVISLSSSQNNLNPSPKPAQRKSVIAASQKLKGVGTPETVVNVKEMVEKYSQNISGTASKFECPERHSVAPVIDNSPRSKKAAKILYSSTPGHRSTMKSSAIVETPPLTLQQTPSPMVSNDNIPSDKLDQTFDVDKPAIPNTPCIDALDSKRRRSSRNCNSSKQETVSIPVPSSRSDSTSRKSRNKHLSSERKLTRRKLELNFSNTDSSKSMKSDRVSPVKNGNSSLPLADSSANNEPLFTKCKHPKDKPSKLFKLLPCTATGLNTSSSLTAWELNGRGAKVENLRHTQSAQHLVNGNCSNNCAVAEGDGTREAICSTPENILADPAPLPCISKTGVDMCSPIAQDPVSVLSEEKCPEEEPRKEMSPAVKIDPHMHTVIQSLRKHGIPSLTERLLQTQGSDLPVTDEELTPKTRLRQRETTPRNGLRYRERSPLRYLDANRPKYQLRSLDKNVLLGESLAKEAKTELDAIVHKQPKMQPLQIQVAHPNLHQQPKTQQATDAEDTNNRLEMLKQQRRKQRALAAKPYARQTNAARQRSQRQALTAALRVPASKAMPASTSNPTTATSNTVPSYMLSTFAATQRVTGPDRVKTSVFPQTSEPQRRLTTWHRNKSVFTLAD